MTHANGHFDQHAMCADREDKEVSSVIAPSVPENLWRYPQHYCDLSCCFHEEVSYECLL
jgi:hypothetical protein